MKILNWISNNILFFLSIFLLAFIPLYPKLPLLDVPHTWVYVRIEDFFVALSVGIFFLLLLAKKATLKTPLTVPIFLFWLVGLISTVFAIVFIFPTIANVFPNVAIFNYLRRIEYISLFFVGFSAFAFFPDNQKLIRPKLKGMRGLGIGICLIIFLLTLLTIFFPSLLNISGLFDNLTMTGIWFLLCLSYVVIFVLLFNRKLYSLLSVLSITLILVVLYGLGQKGIPLGWEARLPAFSTMNEEFAKGIPLHLSALARIPSTFAGHYDLAAYLVMLIAIMGSMVFGFKNWLLKLFFLFSGISGLVLLMLTASRVSFAVYLLTICFMLILQKKKWFIIPVIILSILLLNSFQGLTQRFTSTISQVDLVVDARTGKAVGVATKDKNEPSKVVIEETDFTGESLPQGTGYINIPGTSSESDQIATELTYKRTKLRSGTVSAEVTNIEGDFVVKRVLAYDVSFTTRFQGEWPRALEAFNRNILLGSGYSSISLATDNNYLRILGEVGLLGLLSYLLIFVITIIYVYKVLPHVDSKPARSFVIGTMAALFGVGLNAILIDVFEASKVAFIMWLLVGICLGILSAYKKDSINYLKEIKTLLISPIALIVYLLLITFGIFSVMLGNYFIGDDFTWLRWVADCKKVLFVDGAVNCQPLQQTLLSYFTNSDGFFYRPGTKLYFLVMYSLFWLNQNVYHLGSLLLHFSAAAFVFLIGYKLLKNKVFGFIGALVFLVMSVHAESIYWISVSGHLIAANLILFGLYMEILLRETRKWYFIIPLLLSICLAPLFHEFGIVMPFMVIALDVILFGLYKNKIRSLFSYVLYLLPIPIYLWVRNSAKSHWFNGDYSYSLVDLPYNIIGNLAGYLGIILAGSTFLPFYDQMRMYGRDNIGIVMGSIVVFFVVVMLLYIFVFKRIKLTDKKILLILVLWFVFSLVPFLGLGNITTRYAYLPSVSIALFIAWGLYKFYGAVSKVNKFVAVIIIGGLLIVYAYLQVSELWRINKDWARAGTITQTLQRDFYDTYLKTRAFAVNPVFYFTNVPIKEGEAWIFPVGLSDALWFTFQNENLTVVTTETLDEAFVSSEASTSAKVFEFDENGKVFEVIREEVISPTQ